MLLRPTLTSVALSAPRVRVERRALPAAWAHGWLARLARDLLQHVLVFPLLARLVQRIEVVGKEHLASVDGPAVLVANHSGHLDPVVLARALPPRLRRRLVIATGEDVLYQGRKRPLGAAASLLMGAFPFPRDGRPEEALGRAGAMLDAGRLLLLFPEGKLSPAGELGRFRSGAARLAAAHGVPVIPARLDGAYQLDRPGRLLRRARVRVTFGEPIDANGFGNATAATARIRETIAGLT